MDSKQTETELDETCKSQEPNLDDFAEDETFSDADLEGLELLTASLVLGVFEYLDWQSLLRFCLFFDSSLNSSAREDMIDRLRELRVSLMTEVEVDEEVFMELVVEVGAIKEVCEATAARLTRSSLSELRVLHQAPQVCCDAMACAVVLLNGDTRDLSWGNALSLLSNPTNFLSRMAEFDPQPLLSNPKLLEQFEDLLKLLPATSESNIDDDYDDIQTPNSDTSFTSSQPSTPQSSVKKQAWNSSVNSKVRGDPSSPHSEKKRFSQSPLSKTKRNSIERTGHILARWVKEIWLLMVTESEISDLRASLRENIARMHAVGIASLFIFNRENENLGTREAYRQCLTPYETMETCHKKLKLHRKKSRGTDSHSNIPGRDDVEGSNEGNTGGEEDGDGGSSNIVNETSARSAEGSVEDGSVTNPPVPTRLSPPPTPPPPPPPPPPDEKGTSPGDDVEEETHEPNISPTAPPRSPVALDFDDSDVFCTIPPAGIWYWVHEFYKVQCPEKMDRVSEVCDDWAGQEALLLSSLRSKYMGQNLGAARAVRIFCVLFLGSCIF